MDMIPEQMRAIFLVKNGDANHAFEMRTISIPEIRDDELLVKVESFGLNYAEVMARRGLYRDSPPLPFIPGYDLAGRVVKAGKKVSPDLVGKRIAGLSKFGSYAEYAVVKEKMLVPIAEDMNAVEGTAIGVQFNTAYHMACQAINLFPNERVLIRAAAGGVGTALVQLCQWKGCEIVALVGTDEKVEALKNKGVPHVFNYKKQEAQLQAHLKDNPQDVIFNPVAGKTFKQDYQALRPGGRLVLFGASSRSSMKGPFADLRFLKTMGLMAPIFLVGHSRSIIGVNMLKIALKRPEIIQDSMKNVVELYEKGILKPHIEKVFDANQIADAHALLEGGKTSGKIALSW